MDRLRLVGDGTPNGTRVTLGNDLVPGVERAQLDINARTGRTELRLTFGYVELDLSVPGVGCTPVRSFSWRETRLGVKGWLCSACLTALFSKDAACPNGCGASPEELPA